MINKNLIIVCSDIDTSCDAAETIKESLKSIIPVKIVYGNKSKSRVKEIATNKKYSKKMLIFVVRKFDREPYETLRRFNIIRL